MTVMTSVANIISIVVCNGTYPNCCVMTIIIDLFEVDVSLRSLGVSSLPGAANSRKTSVVL
jgi:hypothetical protein